MSSNEIYNHLKMIFNLNELLKLIEIKENLNNNKPFKSIEFPLHYRIVEFLKIMNKYNEIKEIYLTYSKNVFSKIYPSFVDKNDDFISKRQLYVDMFFNIFFKTHDHLFSNCDMYKIYKLHNENKTYNWFDFERSHEFKNKIYEINNILKYNVLETVEDNLMESTSLQDFLLRLYGTIPNINFYFIMDHLIHTSQISKIMNDVLFDSFKEVIFYLISNEKINLKHHSMMEDKLTEYINFITNDIVNSSL